MYVSMSVYVFSQAAEPSNLFAGTVLPANSGFLVFALFLKNDQKNK